MESKKEVEEKSEEMPCEDIIQRLMYLYDTPEKCYDNRETLDKILNSFVKEILSDEKSFKIENDEDSKRVAQILDLFEKINIYKEASKDSKKWALNLKD